MRMWTEIASIVGVLGAIAVAWYQVRKVQAQYPSRKVQDGVSLVDAAGKLLDDYRKEVKLLRDDVAALRAELGEDERKIETLREELRAMRRQMDNWRRGVSILIGQLRDAGLSPEWEPDEAP